MEKPTPSVTTSLGQAALSRREAPPTRSAVCVPVPVLPPPSHLEKSLCFSGPVIKRHRGVGLRS